MSLGNPKQLFSYTSVCSIFCVQTLSPSSAVKRPTPYKYGTTSSNAVVHLLQVRLITVILLSNHRMVKSTFNYTSSFSILCVQTLRPSSAVKMRTPFKSRSPPSYAVVDLSQVRSLTIAATFPILCVQTQTPSSVVKMIQPPSPILCVQTQTPSSVVKRRTPFKSKSQSKAKENLLQVKLIHSQQYYFLTTGW